MEHKRRKGQANQAYRLKKEAGRHSRLDSDGNATVINRGDTFHPTETELKSFGDKFEMVAAVDNQPTFTDEDIQTQRETTTAKAKGGDVGDRVTTPVRPDLDRKRIDPEILEDEGGSKPREMHVDAAREVNFGGREEYKAALGTEKLDADDEVDVEMDEKSNDASGTEDDDEDEDTDDEDEDDGLDAGDFTSDAAHKAWTDAGSPKLGKASGKGGKHTVSDVKKATSK